MSFPLPIIKAVGSVPNSYTPPEDMQGLLEALPNFITLALNDTGPSVTINPNGAGADLNGIWVWMLNAAKLPPRLMTGYQHNWWNVYTGRPYELRYLLATPTNYFDASGRGVEGSGWEGWCLCNGQNGTVNLQNLFIVAGYKYTNQWVTNVWSDYYGNFSDTGGGHGAQSRLFQINLYQLPYISLYVNYNDYLRWTPSGHGGNWTAISSDKGDPTIMGSWTYPLDNWQQMVSLPISRIPPFISVGLVQFMGY